MFTGSGFFFGCRFQMHAPRRAVVPKKTLVLGFGLLVVVLMAYQVESNILIAKAVLPPHATASQIGQSLVKPPYQMATPHRTVGTLLREYISRSSTVCAAQDCDSTHQMASCNDNCFGFCGHCPDCVMGPCTVYKCALVVPSINSLCVMRNNTAPCTTCRNDQDVDCRHVF